MGSLSNGKKVYKGVFSLRYMNEKAINDFLDSKKGTSSATQYHYKARLDVLQNYLNKNKIAIARFNQKDLINFLAENYEKFSPKSMNHIKAVVISFIKYHFAKDWLIKFPNLSAICKGQKVKPRYSASQMLSTEEVQSLIQAENNYIWKTAFSLQFYGGCRPSEICNLKWSDLTFTDEGVYFKIYSAKNNKNFEKFVPVEFSNYLKEMKKTSKSEYLFINTKGSPLDRVAYYKHLKRLGKKVFPKKQINPYLLRHSIATILYGKADKGELSDEVVAKQLGHSKSMREVYTHFDVQTLRENAKKIYIKPDKYTPEKKVELELKIEKQELEIAKWKNQLAETQNLALKSIDDLKKELNKYVAITNNMLKVK